MHNSLAATVIISHRYDQRPSMLIDMQSSLFTRLFSGDGKFVNMGCDSKEYRFQRKLTLIGILTSSAGGEGRGACFVQ